MGGLGLRLKVGEGRRQARFTQLDLDQEPRPAVFHHHKIHFAFLLVAQIAQLEVAKSKIRPAFDRLQQMAGDQSFRPRSIVRQPTPVPWNHFGSFRRALATFVNHGRTMNP